MDISDHSIEAVIFQKSLFGQPKVLSYARTLLYGEVVKDGIIKKPERLVESLTKLLASALPKPIKTKYCILSLPDSQVFTAIFKLPAGLKREEIKNTIPFKAEEVIPFRSSEIYFDFKTIAKSHGVQEVFYAAVPKRVVDPFSAVLGNVGLVPLSFDLESLSLARAVVQKLPKTKSGKKIVDQATLLMDIGARTTNLNIFDRNGIRQSLTVKIAGDRFTKSIASNLNLPLKDAEKLKMKAGFDPDQEGGRLVLILQKEMRRIVKETSQLIKYYEDETGRKVGLVILAGGSSLLPGVTQYLSENLGLPVEVGNPLMKFQDPKKLIKFKNKAVLFANVLGLGLRSIAKDPVGSDINLLPVNLRRFEFKPDKTNRVAWRRIYLRTLALTVLILAFGSLIFLKNRGFDLYSQVVNEPEYQTDFSGEDLNVEILDQLRNELLATNTATTTPIQETVTKIKIKSVPAGYINVRNGSGTSYAKIGQAASGQEYVLVSEGNGWYEIQLKPDLVGWVYGIYAEKLE